MFGGRTSRERQQDAQFQQQFQPLIQQQTQASQTALGKAVPLLDSAISNVQKPIDYWSTLLSGDRGAMSALLGPELDAISARDAANRNAIFQFSPRGTAMSSRLGELDRNTASDINRSFLQVRPQAAQQLADLAQLLFGSGTALFNASTGASGNALGNLLQNRQLNLSERGMRTQGLQEGLFGLGRLVGGFLG